ncbi:MAG: hypothetical protein KDA96_19900 [Planctomycetaceae bacterium]|nr:hypothetical protein [Planctomycetaceae bacterium]MCA9065347.1 hypothetical protein [Planctomycetaceae bacterium]
MNSVLVETLRNLIPAIPTFLVHMTGLILAIVCWNRHPRVSMWLCGGCGLALLVLIFRVVTYSWLVQMIFNGVTERETARFLMSAVQFGFGLVNCAAEVMILIAVFAGRRSATATGVPV